MLYLVIETFKQGDALPVYRRFRDRGRLAPEGLRYVTSWVTGDLRRCFQVMECEDRGLLEIVAWLQSRYAIDAERILLTGLSDGATFTLVSDSEISVLVPAAAVTGRVSVTTPGGTATSPTVFVITALPF